MNDKCNNSLHSSPLKVMKHEEEKEIQTYVSSDQSLNCHILVFGYNKFSYPYKVDFKEMFPRIHRCELEL